MKTAAIPAVRVSPELRQAAEGLRQNGESLSNFLEGAVQRNVTYRQLQKAFIERGLASAEAARTSGADVSATALQSKLVLCPRNNTTKPLDLGHY